MDQNTQTPTVSIRTQIIVIGEYDRNGYALPKMMMPFKMLMEHEGQILCNNLRTLEHLHDTGGIRASYVIAALEDRRLQPNEGQGSNRMWGEEINKKLEALIVIWKQNQPKTE